MPASVPNAIQAVERGLAALPPAEFVLAGERSAEADRNFFAKLITIWDANGRNAVQGDFRQAERAEKFDWEPLGRRVGC